MSPADDHLRGMRNTDLLEDEAIDAFFLGEPDPRWEQDATLVQLASDVTVAASGVPPVLDPTLAKLLGETAVTSSQLRLVAVEAPSRPGGGISEYLARRRDGDARHQSRLWRTVAGAAVAAASMTVAGISGVVPEPAVELASQVVEALTPFELSQDRGKLAPSSQTPPSVPASNQVAPPSGTAPVLPPPAPEPTAAPDIEGVGPAVQPIAPAPPAATGVDRARQTPAGAFLPPFVPGPPAPADEGGSDNTRTSGANGMDRAGQTPAGSIAPPFGGTPGPLGR